MEPVTSSTFVFHPPADTGSMTMSIWRYAHFVLALVASAFLVMAAVSGIFLSFEAAQNRLGKPGVIPADTVSLITAIHTVKKTFDEPNELSIDANGFVVIKGVDTSGADGASYLDPISGKLMGDLVPQSELMKWMTSFHRSLFLHQAGRIVVGIASFCLFLITLTGFVLVLKRQKGLRRFFAPLGKESGPQYWHVVLGRISLPVIIIIAITGSWLTLHELNLLPEKQPALQLPENFTQPSVKMPVDSFPAFANVSLNDIQQLEFPFAEDPEEYYTLRLRDREILVNQFDGSVVSEVVYRKAKWMTAWGLSLHTGRNNAVWAIVLGIGAVNILVFIVSGFMISIRRRTKKAVWQTAPTDATHIILVGSENGSTWRSAEQVFRQLTDQGISACMAELNTFQPYPTATHLVIFTSTHGWGDPPPNADKFEKLLAKVPQVQTIQVSVLGFGSKDYPDFCGYAKMVEEHLYKLPWARRLLPLYTVEDKSAAHIAAWAAGYSRVTGIALATTTHAYQLRPPAMQVMTVVQHDAPVATEEVFRMALSVKKGRFTSGDLLAIYPAGDNRERMYSIAKIEGQIQLVVKLHPEGLGSGFLHALKTGDAIEARLVDSPHFHFPSKNKPVALIANGTGIAPFLGMVHENYNQVETVLYAGFRHRSALVTEHEKMLSDAMAANKLKGYHFGFSREGEKQYVTDLVKRDAAYFSELLLNGGVVMICGALAMQQDVEQILSTYCLPEGKQLADLKASGQLLTDCY